ncbi:dynactin subunit 1 isoform X2 [Lycorma delicatula]|uniref:dynactin subunit 1 isoform X2 n=1 Tax=Lycorma delicatula TaxID=130591 RepID=UPI003F518C22
MSIQAGQKVEVTGKDVQGVVAYVGTTLFAPGKWVGIILNEPKGKNNGTVQGKQYFECKENYGMFVRPLHLTLLDEAGNRIDLASPSPGGSSATSPDDTPRSTLRSRLSRARRKSSPATSLPPSRASSRQSLSSVKSGRAESRSREDVSVNPPAPTPTHHTSEQTSKRASFLEFKTPVSRIPSFKSSASTGKKISFIPKKADSSENDQTGFVETLKPQFTPGQVLSSPGAAHHRLHATSEHNVQQPAWDVHSQNASPTPISISSASPNTTASAATNTKSPLVAVDSTELDSLKSQVKDLTEKLDTIKIKHKEKVHEVDSLRIQLDQANEFKVKIMETQASLKKELEKVKREKQELIESREELSDLTDTLEMATLDKEMAEEKVDTLQLELESAKEKIEELTLDLELLKEELSDKGSGEACVSSYQMKQLEQQNTRLRETLVRMRDLSAHEKHETQKLQRDLEAKRNEIVELTKGNEKLQARVGEMESQVADLHEQVDAALGAEEMVVQLGQQKLVLEDRVKELEECIMDLEAIQELNDQLQEDSRELENDLREEVDLANAATREALREKEAVLESLADRELTIVKFRELVHKLQEQCMDLRTQLERESSNKATIAAAIPEMQDFKKMFAETKAHARAIDLELRRMEVQESQQHVEYLAAYMPDSFMSRGGDNDAVLVLLLIPRILWKCDVLLSQIRDKFPSVELVDRKTLIKGHAVEQFASRSRLSMHIYSLQGILRQFLHGLNTCSPETLLKVGTALPDMLQQEKAVDSYIEMLKRDQLDENVNSEALERCVTYFTTTHPLFLLASGETYIHHSYLITDISKTLSAATDSIRTDCSIVQVLAQTGTDPSDLILLCQHLSTVCEVIQQHLKQIRRRSVDFSPVLPLPTIDFSQCCVAATKITKIMRDLAKAALSQISVTGESEAGIDNSKLVETLTSSWERVYDGEESSGPIASVKQSAALIAADIAQIAQALQEAESNPPSSVKSDKRKQQQVVAPIVMRAKQVKSELEETKALRSRLEARESDIRELKLALRAKQEELGEMTVRRELIEKRLANATRDNELHMEKLQRKLEESQQQLKRKEKEFEETMDHLQADIDSLENERGELKDKVKTLSKKVFYEGIKSSVASPVHTSPGGQGVKVIESPILLNEINSLKIALKHERNERIKLQYSQYSQQLAQLKPIFVPVKKTGSSQDRINTLVQKIKSLQKEVHDSMALPKVIDITKQHPGVRPCIEKLSPNYHIVQSLCRVHEIREKIENLQNEVNNEVLRRNKGSRIDADLTTFPTPEMARVLQESKEVIVGELTVPKSLVNEKQDVVTLQLEPATLHCLQDKLASYCFGSATNRLIC